MGSSSSSSLVLSALPTRERERRYGSRIVVEDAPSRVRRDDDL